MSLKFESLTDPTVEETLRSLPWEKPLESWRSRDATFLRIKSGISRHVVRFIRKRRRRFAVKETSTTAARHEFDAYLTLSKLGVPTLSPVGIVVRDRGRVLVPTVAGPQTEVQSDAYLVTELLDFALPHSFLFKRAFASQNRRYIWDAIVRLFVKMHCNGVFWGDASLSNMMIVFAHQHLPEVGVRTVLRAVLADAETVEFHPVLSDSMRRADVDAFLESIAWTDADLQASGVVRDTLMTRTDQEYLLQRYRDMYEIEREEQSFGIITKIDVETLLGPFQTKGQSRALLKHIYEHRWYLSEEAGKEVSLEAAAVEWYTHVFKPALQLFNDFGLADEFPDSTAASLYLEIMLHKYYLSEKVGRDVGLVTTFRDFAKQFDQNRTLREKFSRAGESLQKHFGR